MSKIIKIVDEIVSIGTDDGKIKEVRKTDINFEPSVGDEVELFENEENVYPYHTGACRHVVIL